MRRTRTTRIQKRIMPNLNAKYQPHWEFKNESAARKMLKFQKEMNPSTYAWLKTKDVMISGKRKSIASIEK